MIEPLIRKYNIKLKKRANQFFLNNEKILNFEVSQAEITEKDAVLEIGSGIGNLTEKLAEKAKKVYAVEREMGFIPILRERLNKLNNIEVINGDILKIEVPEFDKCVSNIPYTISAKITEFLAKRNKLSVICYQKEFAQRLVSSPGERNYSRITVLTNFYFIPVFLKEVKREDFFPKPEVDSAIVKLFPRKNKPKVNESLFFKTVKALFIHKNKKVRNAFYDSRHFFKLNKGKAKEIMNIIPYHEERVINLDIKELGEISNFLSSLQKR